MASCASLYRLLDMQLQILRLAERTRNFKIPKIALLKPVISVAAPSVGVSKGTQREEELAQAYDYITDLYQMTHALSASVALTLLMMKFP